MLAFFALPIILFLLPIILFFCQKMNKIITKIIMTIKSLPIKSQHYTTKPQKVKRGRELIHLINLLIKSILPPTTRHVEGIVSLMTTQKHISYSARATFKRSDVKLVFTIYNKQSAKDYNK